jgi:hypothetical protein
MAEPFTITSFASSKEVEENLRRAGVEAQDEKEIVASLVALARFLEDRGLARRKLQANGALVGGKAFALRSSDLTEDGLAVIRAGFGAWEAKGCPGSDLRPLERAYKKVIAKNR